MFFSLWPELAINFAFAAFRRKTRASFLLFSPRNENFAFAVFAKNTKTSFLLFSPKHENFAFVCCFRLNTETSFLLFLPKNGNVLLLSKNEHFAYRFCLKTKTSFLPKNEHFVYRFCCFRLKTPSCVHRKCCPSSNWTWASTPATRWWTGPLGPCASSTSASCVGSRPTSTTRSSPCKRRPRTRRPTSGSGKWGGRSGETLAVRDKSHCSFSFVGRLRNFAPREATCGGVLVL